MKSPCNDETDSLIQSKLSVSVLRGSQEPSDPSQSEFPAEIQNILLLIWKYQVPTIGLLNSFHFLD